MLRMAIQSDGHGLRRWEADCVDRLLQSGAARIELHLVREPGSSGGGRERAPRLRRLLERRLAAQTEQLRPAETSPIPPEAAVVRIHGEDGEGGAEEAGRWRDAGLDAILNLSASEVTKRWAEAARLGVWRFEYGEGGTDALRLLLRNLLDKQTTATISLVRQDGRTGERTVLRQGTFATGVHSAVNHLNQLYRFGADWPAYVCRRLSAGDAAAGPERSLRAPGEPLRPLSNGETLRIAARLAAGKGRRWFSRWFVAEQWNVGIAEQPIERFLSAGRLPKIRWLPRKTNFLADPFGIHVNGQLHLLAEQFDYASGKGVIAAIRPEAGSAAEARTVMNLPVHMSYPYLLEHEGRIYCVPETYQAGEAALFRAVRFPERWEKVGPLVRGFRPVDATLYRHEGRWWLFCTDEDTGWNSHLYLWYADELSGPWRPHPKNPVKMDVRSARPAGTPFRYKGALYRPAQDCSRTYGGAVVLNRIVTLTTEDFREEPVVRLAPDPDGPYRDGLHTLSAAGSRTLVDAKSERVDLRVFWLRLSSAMQGGRR